MLPSPEEMGRAVRDGVPVRAGLPVVVRRENETWIPNLAAVKSGEPDPWLCTRVTGPVVDLSTAGDSGLSVAGHVVTAADIAHVRAALRLAPVVGTRHDAESNRRRLTAGVAALAIRDSMVRARMLDAVDGWSALEGVSTVIDRDEQHGVLLDPPAALELSVRILVVRCPSTARVYALRVPAEMRSASEARIWTMRGVVPEVES